MLRRTRFDAIVPLDETVPDARHVHLSHTLHGHTRDVVMMDFYLLPDDPEEAARVASAAEGYDRLFEATRDILRLLRWTPEERAMLGGWLE